MRSMKSKMTATLLTVFMVLSLVSPALAAGLSDLDGHWAKASIEKALSNKLVTGYPDGSFKPDNEVTRAEFVTIANKAFKKQGTGAKAEFADVNESDWFAANVAIAKAAGYITGYEDGTFRPDSPITRQEATAMIYRLVKLDKGAKAASFSDAGDIASWAKDAVNAVADKKIINGYPDGTFKPLNNITRAEAVIVLDKANVAGPVAPVATAGLKGKVVKDGKAVAGATVKLFLSKNVVVVAEVQTDDAGKYSFDVPEGTYDLTAEKDKFVGNVGGTVVGKDGAEAKDIVLAEGVVVSGTLFDKDGKPLADTNVALSGSPAFVVKTDAKGNYSLRVLPNHQYKMSIYKPLPVPASIKGKLGEVISLMNKLASDLQSLVKSVQAEIKVAAADQSLGETKTDFAGKDLDPSTDLINKLKGEENKSVDPTKQQPDKPVVPAGGGGGGGTVITSSPTPYLLPTDVKIQVALEGNNTKVTITLDKAVSTVKVSADNGASVDAVKDLNSDLIYTATLNGDFSTDNRVGVEITNTANQVMTLDAVPVLGLGYTAVTANFSVNVANLVRSMQVNGNTTDVAKQADNSWHAMAQYVADGLTVKFNQ